MTDRDWSDARSSAPKPAEKPSHPIAEWLAGLSVAGKMMLFGAVLGIVASFLPLVRGEPSVRIIEDPRGVIGLLSYFVVAALSVLLFLPEGHPQQTAMAKAAVAAGAVALLTAAWLAVEGWKTGRYAVAINLAAALTAAVGAVRKGVREKIFQRPEKKRTGRRERA